MTKDICPAVGEELGVLEFDQDPGRPYLRVATAEDKNLVALPCLDVCAQGAIGTETSSKVSHNNTTPTGRGGGGAAFSMGLGGVRVRAQGGANASCGRPCCALVALRDSSSANASTGEKARGCACRTLRIRIL